MSTTTQLYFIRHDDRDTGEPLDLIVEAPSPASAAILWRSYWEDTYSGLTKPELVYALPALTGTPHALNWGALPGVVGWQI